MHQEFCASRHLFPLPLPVLLSCDPVHSQRVAQLNHTNHEFMACRIRLLTCRGPLLIGLVSSRNFRLGLALLRSIRAVPSSRPELRPDADEARGTEEGTAGNAASRRGVGRRPPFLPVRELALQSLPLRD